MSQCQVHIFFQCTVSETKGDPMSQKQNAYILKNTSETKVVMHFCDVTLEYSSIIFSFKYSLGTITLYNHNVPIHHMNLHKTPVDINTCTLKD